MENAGTLQALGSGLGVLVQGAAGGRVMRVLAGGTTVVSGTLSVQAAIENDGTLRAVAGGTLTQSLQVEGGGASGGVFDAQGSGVLSFSSVVMGAGSSATGSGTIRFAGGASRVEPGAGYAAGITEVVSSGNLDFDADGSTGALRLRSAGIRRGEGTLTVGGGVSELAFGTLSEGGVTAFSSGSQTTMTNDVYLDGGHTLRLHGATAWNDGSFVIVDAGSVENAGTLQALGSGLGVLVQGAAGGRVMRVLAGGTTVVSGTLSVQAAIENDGTLRAVAGGTLTQSLQVEGGGASGGVFDAQGSGVLSFSSVVMGAGSSATGSGTIRFAGGASRVEPGAGYAAGITEVVSSGNLDFDADGSTGALRLRSAGIRRGEGTLTVGGGVSELAFGTLSEGGVTAFSSGSQTTMTNDVYLDGGHTLRLHGATAWNDGSFVIVDAGSVENAGTLQALGRRATAPKRHYSPARALPPTRRSSKRRAAFAIRSSVPTLATMRK